ncbi:hypothetical protein SS05631_c37000 [Sinorhizobium sp. CCBAU 05631]|uniref:Uncharacterized protein n=1 Tax=Rhizobium fredii TaxID=380 RepID=A0A2L0HBU1_RHIFR|nr:hypothetical protein SS05631_c37000 [Sinorhizobium sp. CCBAU 05631]AUX78239.1 hypothetical protein NXT3_CH03715 [Sinorhizobium fredii]
MNTPFRSHSCCNRDNSSYHARSCTKPAKNRSRGKRLRTMDRPPIPPLDRMIKPSDLPAPRFPQVFLKGRLARLCRSTRAILR